LSLYFLLLICTLLISHSLVDSYDRYRRQVFIAFPTAYKCAKLCDVLIAISHHIYRPIRNLTLAAGVA